MYLVKRILSSAFFLFLVYFNGNSQELDLSKQQWIHGSADCKLNSDVKIQVVRVNKNTYILRQNKCVHYEAPFMFLFFGEERALLLDTGATKEEEKFPLRKTVDSLILTKQSNSKKMYKLTVAHTHSHSDHHAADIQFKNRPNTTVVGLTIEDIKSFFKIENGNSSYDLGERTLSILHIPGHHKTSIAVYDPQTKWLLTGDTFYPGRLYVNDWMAFKKSIKNLVNFTNKHVVSSIIGNHIEMSNVAGKDYPIGSTYQPNEHELPLSVSDLKELDGTLDEIGNKIQKKIHNKFIIYPNN